MHAVKVTQNQEWPSRKQVFVKNFPSAPWHFNCITSSLLFSFFWTDASIGSVVRELDPKKKRIDERFESESTPRNRYRKPTLSPVCSPRSRRKKIFVLKSAITSKQTVYLHYKRRTHTRPATDSNTVHLLAMQNVRRLYGTLSSTWLFHLQGRHDSWK